MQDCEVGIGLLTRNVVGSCGTQVRASESALRSHLRGSELGVRASACNQHKIMDSLIMNINLHILFNTPFTSRLERPCFMPCLS